MVKVKEPATTEETTPMLLNLLSSEDDYRLIQMAAMRNHISVGDFVRASAVAVATGDLAGMYDEPVQSDES